MAQFEAWRRGFVVAPEQIASQPTFVAQDLGAIGSYSLCVHGGQCELDNLWLLPQHMGRGCGRLLLAHAMRTARHLGLAAITIDADPHAEAFYVRCGALVTGTVPAPVDGEPQRRRPRLLLPTAVRRPAARPAPERRAAKAG